MEQQWGRVDEDGTVWVRYGDGERQVGQYPGASNDTALAYYGRKYDELAGQITLLQQRITAHQVNPHAAQESVTKLRDSVAQAHAVGDLQALEGQLDEITALIDSTRQELHTAKLEAKAKALQERTTLVEQAETLAAIDETAPAPRWKEAGDQLRDIFETWKQQQHQHRLDKADEAQLWTRLKKARTEFDRRRRHHFAALDEQRAHARSAKEEIIEQAEELAESTQWQQTTQEFRRLLDRWKTTGRVGRRDDDELWAQFKAAQDAFFAAKSQAMAQQDSQQHENLAAKNELLTQAEQLLPVKDSRYARRVLRGIHEKWDAIGKVPKDAMHHVESRMRAVEQAIRSAEQEQTRASSPVADRAHDTVRQLESAIAELETECDRARATGNAAALATAEQALAAKQLWLDQAKKTLQDLGN